MQQFIVTEQDSGRSQVIPSTPAKVGAVVSAAAVVVKLANVAGSPNASQPPTAGLGLHGTVRRSASW
jgi:hypothetical protein